MLHLRHPASRRSFLTAGALGLGGWTLTDRLRAAAAGSAPRLVQDRSVVFLFLHGGPSQFETFDPKMDAPSGIRSVTGEIPTSLPGVTFGAGLPRLAKLAHKLAVVRSFTTGDGNHDLKPVVGRHSLGANLGSLYARVAGTSHPATGLPRNLALFPRAVDPSALEAVRQFGDFAATGPLNPSFAPFVPGEGGDLQTDLSLHLPPERFDDRRALLAALDGLQRRFHDDGGAEGMDRFRQQAFDTILKGAADAFDLSREDPRLLARYDTAPLVRPESIRTVWANHLRYRDHVRTLGKLLLLARRLCERGAGFVTVSTNFVWDMHADKNNATVSEGMEYVGRPFDHAVSAFIEDVEARGLSDRILLVCCGEMGRSPKLNARGGRDHWGRLAPLVLYGGGLKTGQVIGRSTRDGGEPDDDPVTLANLTSTLMHRLFDPGELRLVSDLSADLNLALAGAPPIRGLI
jgi:uncharacterized protein (DUF1501 family)